MDFSISERQAVWFCAISMAASDLWFAYIELTDGYRSGDWMGIAVLVAANVLGYGMLSRFSKGKFLASN
jgi:hypothetical protein